MSIYGNLATLVVLAHFAFILFVMFGGLLALRWRWVPWAHIPCFVWGAGIEVVGGICPLTPLENHFRRLAGESTYGEGFITHYLGPLIYPAGLTRGTQFVLLGILLAVNLLGYSLVIRKMGTVPISRK
jgi:hypothetical protein